jgi:hypothetical protein
MALISVIVYLAGALFLTLLIKTALQVSRSANLSADRSRFLRFGVVFLSVCLVLGLIGAVTGGAVNPISTPIQTALSGTIVLLGWYSAIALFKTRVVAK